MKPPFTTIKGMQKDTTYYNSIVPYLLKTSSVSRYHIIAVSRGWIFDPNLNYRIVLNYEIMNWCARHGKEIIFNGFYEQANEKTHMNFVLNKIVIHDIDIAMYLLKYNNSDKRLYCILSW